MLQVLIGRISHRAAGVIAAALLFFAGTATQAAEPIKIGFGMAQTGPLAANGKSALLAMQIWAEDVNAKGGLLGRPVKLIYYDDQSNPSTVPGLYTKLLDVDKVDLVVGGYATNMLAPAMPVVIQHNVTFIGLFGLAVNSQFNYSRYFSMAPSGPDPKLAFSKEFFTVAMAQNPKPKTVAIVAADAEFSRNAADGARDNAKAAGLKIVYDKTYPPSTTDFTPVVRAIQATNPDLVFVGSYPLDSVGMINAANEVGLKTKMFGGGMVGLQSTATKTKMGPLLNGIVNYDFWEPVPNMQFPGVLDVLKKYQAKAAGEGVDALGYYIAPWAYADLQVLGQAVEATKSLDQGKLAAYMHANTFKTVLGNIKFGKSGEWEDGRVILVQFHDIKGNDLEQFRTMGTQTVLAPAEYKSGNIVYPYRQ
ncbi:MAG TPA: amino acid ABC transporter substrate-binding protein [Candidatus Sulfotelmatobacter sp.]|nr:amino acid ABC transporter substrate-binding protein [Candidatus Sulfotelmatobacter sp.]